MSLVLFVLYYTVLVLKGTPSGSFWKKMWYLLVLQPCVQIAALQRSRHSIEERGKNWKALWKTDASTILVAVSTIRFLLKSCFRGNRTVFHVIHHFLGLEMLISLIKRLVITKKYAAVIF